MERKITVELLDEAQAFVYSQRLEVQKKISYNLARVASGEKDAEIFKKLEDTDIWEFRTLYNGTAYRLFAFWDTESGALVVATHGIVKKTQKTPPKEIRKAERIRQEYYNDKNNRL